MLNESITTSFVDIFPEHFNISHKQNRLEQRLVAYSIHIKPFSSWILHWTPFHSWLKVWGKCIFYAVGRKFLKHINWCSGGLTGQRESLQTKRIYFPWLQDITHHTAALFFKPVSVKSSFFHMSRCDSWWNIQRNSSISSKALRNGFGI